MNTMMQEVMPELFTRSEILIWNFADITLADANKNIKEYMEAAEASGQDPRDAFHRQEFNNAVLGGTDSRYLIGRYMEDRSDILGRGSHMAKEGRVYHLAIDIFSRVQETVFAPCDGLIVRSDKEPGLHNYGNYLILKPDDETLPFIFFGHLADNNHELRHVQAGDELGRLGSFEEQENGGWSVHLHLQLLTELPPEGEAPIGYTTRDNMEVNRQRFPDPLSIFPDWKIKR